MSESELKKYWQTYTDAWQFFKRHYSPPKTDAQWEQLIDEANKFITEHSPKGTVSEFAQEIMLTTLAEIENISKGRAWAEKRG